LGGDGRFYEIIRKLMRELDYKNIEREFEKALREAKDVGAEALISACPFCLRGLLDAKKKFDYGLEVYDLAEIVAKLI